MLLESPARLLHKTFASQTATCTSPSDAKGTAVGAVVGMTVGHVVGLDDGASVGTCVWEGDPGS